ncbi:protein phosphatase regulator [Neocucurbitaria cava]|uniref:Protein phosphatase regulator n=1 Tax=Neocucurbitaria cava TaxID=798079 RepID=A0A9W8YB56_9PLEO|nr:protein phosphatase regulator [Neocucurbitaria cava]
MADVLSPPREGSPFHAPIRSPSSTSLSFDSYTPLRKNQYSLPDLRSPSLSSSRTSSLHSTPSSSISLDTKSDESSSEDDGLSFPNYSSARQYRKGASFDMDTSSSTHAANAANAAAAIRPTSLPSPSPSEGPSSDTPLTTPDPLPMSEDDTAVRKEPSHHVDYLSYEWREEDIWSSWRHIVEHRKVYGERSRLENASWRTWAKSQFKLKTVSPETLNWLKDVDVTWLYGPMQPASNRFCSQQNSEPVSRLSKSGSFVNGVKKPILKKRSMSEAMLQKSLSSSSLVKQAAESVQAQQTSGVTLESRKHRPIIGRATPDFPTSSTMSRGLLWEGTDYFSSKSTSGLHTPDHGEKRHIRFDDNVEQCIAVECKDADDDEDDYNHNPWAKYHDEDSSSDEGVVMMKRSRRKRPLSRTASSTSISSDNKTIAPLPSTTLKYRTDSPDVPEIGQHPSHSLGFWRQGRQARLSPSPSQETLKPSNPSRNFLLAEDDEEGDAYFNPSSAYSSKRPSTPTAADPYSLRSSSSSTSLESGGLRRTASGMFMPFEDSEEEPPPPGLLGRVVDTVNTARDIAHVIWNVGWKN